MTHRYTDEQFDIFRGVVSEAFHPDDTFSPALVEEFLIEQDLGFFDQAGFTAGELHKYICPIDAHRLRRCILECCVSNPAAIELGGILCNALGISPKPLHAFRH